MEEDIGVKAPLTRLRRRLSVEQSEDTNSPGPSTPTKKRTGRLAAKPQLELIDENTPGGSSKRTSRKTAVKDVSEALEDKPLTPGRRSARIKSNTSIVSSETTHGYESPRAKRATRRNSCFGCDTSASVTPTKQTKKESLLQLETTLESKPNNITEIVIEESASNNGNDANENVSPRKSPRWRGRQKKEADANKESNLNNFKAINDEISVKVVLNRIKVVLNTEVKENLHEENHKSVVQEDETAPELEKPNNDLSDSSINVIKNLDLKPKRKLSNVNKSMSILEKNNNICLNKKQRTNSLTALSKIQNDDGLFFSDNEISKKKVIKNRNSKEFSIDNSTSGHGKDTSQNMLKKSENKENDTVLDTPNSTKELKVSNEPVPELKSKKIQENVNIAAEDNISVSSFLENAPNIVQSSVFFEDSSDTDGKKKSPEVLLNSSDKCVPVVVTVECKSIDNIDDGNNIQKSPNLKKQDRTTSKNDSCEPMDIDESFPNNITICDSPKSDRSLLDGIENVVVLPSHNNSNHNKSSDKSKYKSSLSPSTSQNLEKTRNESKSTLIISQIKDVSSADNSVSKSPSHKASEILSKSTNYDESKEKKNENKNISLDYSTSTPLQQKKLKKLGLQINTSIINSSNPEHKKSNEDSHISKKDMSNGSRISQRSLYNEKSKEETSNTSSNLLDEEASQASDDYESGDSRDESDRKYEEENEIVEKGETLDSEDEISNDSDYEKDSFVVSSNEDDNELLSGSGDDLSISDNELTMSKKSKIKYNERKSKEQKKASKEMFEARHKLNESKKKQEKDSSGSSDDDIIAPVKKNKHRRLDSTHEESLEISNSSFDNKPSKKRLSLQNKATNENEISTVFDKSLTQNDPLSTEIKLEPQTPMKGLNISTVQIYDKIEEVEVDNNVSFKKSDQTQDALQITRGNVDEDSSISECSEIMNNYDSMLNELNDKENKKIKVHDISLNLNKKNKKQCQEPIVDQLNLTVTNSSKNKKNLLDKNSMPSSHEPKDKIPNELSVNVSKDVSSDSIDLQILFSEDSCDLGEKTTENGTDNIIPLKRTPGKINIFDEGSNENVDAPVEISFKSSKKDRKSSVTDQFNNEKEIHNQDIKKKKKKRSESEVDTTDTSSIPDQLLDSTKKKKLSKSLIDTTDTVETSSQTLNSGKKNKSLSESEFVSDDSKKKKKKLSESQTETTDAVESSFLTLNSSKKKKKTVSESQLVSNDASETPTQFPDSTKKKRTLSEQKIETTDAVNETSFQILNSSKKKKKTISESQLLTNDASNSPVPSLDSTKKKKKRNESDIEDTAMTSTQLDSTKKKKKLSPSQIEPNDTVATSLQSSTSKKKKKKTSLSESQSELIVEDSTNNISSEINKEGASGQVRSSDTSASGLSYSKKRKRKEDGETSFTNTDKSLDHNAVLDQSNTSVNNNRQKKKRKLSRNKGAKSTIEVNPSVETISNKVNINEESVTQLSSQSDQKMKNKKRKRDEDDNGSGPSKIMKQSSFDNVHITKLPASLLSQLDDKPAKELLEKKKSLVVSTTPFVVQETRKRRNKPSNYLEESVYLNDSNHEKKQKKNNKKLKVLPFIPTAATSDSGFTTKFEIKTVSQNVEFVAQMKSEKNFKNDYLYGKKIKRLGTYELYKKQRSAKMSKF